MDPTNTIIIDNRDDLENRCWDIIYEKREKVFNNIRKECLKSLIKYNNSGVAHQYCHSISEFFYDDYEKSFKKEFGEYLEKRAEDIFYS